MDGKTVPAENEKLLYFAFNCKRRIIVYGIFKEEDIETMFL